jgi:heterodisulfide reductase subunit A
MKTIAIIGAGIAGIEAASRLSRFGHKVYLIEKNTKIGGHVAQWDRLFPSQTEAESVLEDLINGLNNRAEVLTNVNVQYCKRKEHQFEIILTDNKNLLVDAILVASGFDAFRAQRKEEYGYGIYENVITSVDLEEMFKKHKVVCKNGTSPNRVAFVHCVGSRDEKVNNRHCSKVCCATAVKQACEIKQLYPNCEVFNLYMDLRMFDRHFEDMYHEAQSKYHVNFIRGRLSEAGENKDHQVVLKAEDTLAGKPLKLTVDLLVLMTGMEACYSQNSLNTKLGLRSDTDGFLSIKDSFTKNNFSTVDGIFVAGACTGAKTIP